MKTCPRNYDRSTWTHTCWAECPIDYPVECGRQCIQQNNNCGRENIAQSSAVAMATLIMATFGVFGDLAKMGKAVGWAVRGTNMLLVAVRSIVSFTRNQMVQDPETSQQKLLLLLIPGRLARSIALIGGSSLRGGRLSAGIGERTSEGHKSDSAVVLAGVIASGEV
ncbi:hypothetical protein PsorP6_010074 [Peronosclerospora sorghi]|uniref:Uncharacterized protein n=1 Tax=Peronosclerospora sorghi TaxID=230839 RepID=A0ACC0VUP2_9STRA|nr:hypothetical protein PsorP6_010074 [Peronosclerospora sorghi]